MKKIKLALLAIITIVMVVSLTSCRKEEPKTNIYKDQFITQWFGNKIGDTIKHCKRVGGENNYKTDAGRTFFQCTTCIDGATYLLSVMADHKDTTNMNPLGFPHPDDNNFSLVWREDKLAINFDGYPVYRFGWVYE